MKASDNPYPSILVAEGATPATPAAGRQTLFFDSADHALKRLDENGDVFTILAYGTDDPSAGGGLAANIGAFYGRDNAGTGEMWLKQAATDTDWTLVA